MAPDKLHVSSTMRKRIAGAIRRAVLREREACAQIAADAFLAGYPADSARQIRRRKTGVPAGTSQRGKSPTNRRS